MDSRKAGYAYLMSLTPLELHKKLVSYFVCQKGSGKLKHHIKSKHQTDYDVIHKNHKFLWEDEEPRTWEANLAKRYYDKLYKEYCICDLSLYKQGKVAMRWRTEQELISGKGQFICGKKDCSQNANLTSWEVNFGYVENEQKKNALVKLRLCTDCSSMLRYKHMKGKFKMVKKRKQKIVKDSKKLKLENHEISVPDINRDNKSEQNDEHIMWRSVNQTVVEEKSRDEDFEEFLNNLML